jgi:hypothetical protein
MVGETIQQGQASKNMAARKVKAEQGMAFPSSVPHSTLPYIPPVPDRRRRIVPEVVLVRRWVIGVLGICRGEGLGKGWDRGGQFTSNLRLRWTDPVTAWRVPSK